MQCYTGKLPASPKSMAALFSGLLSKKTQPAVAATLIQSFQKAQSRQSLMRTAGLSRGSGTEQCYCGSACGQDLADLFLHPGSGWLLTKVVMNNFSLLFRAANRRQLTRQAGRDGTETITILSLFAPSRLLTGTCSPIVTK